MAHSPTPADNELHPIGEVVASVLEDGPKGEVVLSNSGFDYIKSALYEYLDAGEALMDAVDTLLVSAHLIEVEQGSRQVAERLVTLVDRPEVIDALRRVTEQAEARRAQEVAQSAEKFSKFTGQPHNARATTPARSDQPDSAASPKGAVRLGDLAFPKRL